jgi:hypothetical protein
MKIIFILSFGLIISSCSTLDRQITTFEPGRENKFSYRAYADAVYPEASRDAENIRIDWLEQFLTDNSFCSNGYTIFKRQPVLKRKGLLGDVYDIFYYGRCK